MLNVITINAGNYMGRGAEYVNHLSRTVWRNLNASHRFICFTDDPSMLRDDIDARPLPHLGLSGWHNKLAMFKPGLFVDGDRLLWLDLDTVISGSIDEIASYAGDFAMIEDLYFPGQLASGVMAWRAGFGAGIWDSYATAGFPSIEGGDQAWIAKCGVRADILQDVYPGQIASYKVGGGQLAPQTRIVCFHGHPRPHHVTSGWVPALWTGESKASSVGAVRIIH